jgi:hypothetical protein
MAIFDVASNIRLLATRHPARFEASFFEFDGIL